MVVLEEAYGLRNEKVLEALMTMEMLGRSPKAYHGLDAVQFISAWHKFSYRCDRVATIFATVWARVEPGFTWNTGKESLPSINPRVDRMTEMK